MYEKQIQRGAEILDRCMPGWELKIDIPTLQLDSVMSCVLGQLYGDYHVGMAMHEQVEKPAPGYLAEYGNFDWAEDHGFVEDEAHGFGYQCRLTEEWEKFIKERLDAGITL